MSKRWKSSKMMSVNGVAFKRARLTFKNEGEDPKKGEYGHGSQEWLAEKARISPRTVNELEAGRATLKTVDAISNALSIKGRKYIKGYGEDSTTFRVTGVVDFRPIISGRLPGNEEIYRDTPFLVTLIPIVINVDDDFIDTAILQRMRLRLSVGDISIEFKWLYNVALTSRSSTWLGDEEEVNEVVIHSHEPYRESVMFRQDSTCPITWKQFTDHIMGTNDGRILLTLTLGFELFEKQDHIMVSVQELKNLLVASYPSGCPYWVQPNALMV